MLLFTSISYDKARNLFSVFKVKVYGYNHPSSMVQQEGKDLWIQ